MNSYFEDAIKRFKKKFKKKCFINPISEDDSKVFGYLKMILVSLEAPPSLITILDSHKSVSDSDVVLEVEKWIIDNPGAGNELLDEDEEDVVKSRAIPIVHLGDQRFKLSYIYHYEKFDKYSFDGGELLSFCVRLNPVPEDVTRIPILGNHLIEFNKEEDRDEAIDKLDKWLEDNNYKLLK